MEKNQVEKMAPAKNFECEYFMKKMFVNGDFKILT